MAYGVLSTGFAIKSLEAIKESMRTRARAAFGDDIRVEADSAYGQQLDIIATDIFDLWQVGEDTYAASFPDSASGNALEGIGAYTGALKLAATASAVTLLVAGDDGTALSTGRTVQNTSSENNVLTTEAGTLSLASSWANTTAYVVNDVVVNGGNMYVCTVAGTSAGAGGPTGTGTAIVDNTVTWRYVSTDEAYDFVTSEGATTGPIEHLAFELNSIESPVSGWNTVINLLDATTGYEEETDAAFRLRRKALLAAQGRGTPDSIRAAILDVADVTQAFVYKNDEDSVVDGMDPHSIEAVIPPGEGTDQAITNAIGETKGGGIEAFGSSGPFTYTDDQKQDHTIYFSRATALRIYIDMTILTNTNFASTGIADLKAAIVSWADENISIDSDVYAERVKAVAFTIPGIVDVTIFHIDADDPTPTGENNVFPSNREIATFDSGDITVTEV